MSQAHGSAASSNSDPEPRVDDGHLARRLTLPVVGLVLLCAAAVVGLVAWAAHEQDTTYVTQEQHFVVYELDEKVEALSRLAKDFTWYDLAIEKLFTRFDVRFAEDTMGSRLCAERGQTSLLVHKKRQGCRFRVHQGAPLLLFRWYA
ncbi:MAG: hypothetical protein FJX36_13220 [Alphaproteobacteria bacterium]|nr:hypothetical protein [Alphaproteobacteria bacterium]